MHIKKTLLFTLFLSSSFLMGCQKNEENTAASNEVAEASNEIAESINKISDEELLASGQYRDSTTGVIWMRCAIGQTWANNTCTGDALELNARQAEKYFDIYNNEIAFAGHSNWRLPTIGEAAVMRNCNDEWARDVHRGEVLTAEGPKFQTIEGDILTKEIPVGSEMVTVPQGCANKKIVHNRDTMDEKVEDITKPAYDINVFKDQNRSYWTSTRSNGSLLTAPISDHEIVWIYGMPGGALTTTAAGMYFPLRAVRDE